MPSKHFHDIINTMKAIHDRKSHDYAKDTNPFSNFEFAAELIKSFHNPIDQVYVTLIGIKLARLSELLSTVKDAQNEPIDDTFIDASNYFALWGAYYREKKSINEKNRQEFLDKLLPTTVAITENVKINSEGHFVKTDGSLDDDIPF